MRCAARLHPSSPNIRTARFGFSRIALLAFAAVCIASASRAQETRARTQALVPPESLTMPEPATLASPELSLGEAVELTLLYNPELNLTRQDIALAEGQLLQARGSFDHNFGAAPSFLYSTRELKDSELKQVQEFRDSLESIAATFSELRDQLEEALESGGEPPLCPAGLVLGGDDIEIGGKKFNPSVIIRIDGVDIETVCTPDDTTTSKIVREILDGNLNLQRQRDRLARLRADQIERQKTQLALRKEIADTIATKAQLAFERLGVLPTDLISKQISIDLGYIKLFRSGVTLRGDLSLKSNQDNFNDKTLDPGFGALPFQNTFPSFVSLTTIVPLGKGRGTATSAPERAAQAAIEARRYLLRHKISEEVFRTALSHLNLIAARETVALLEESADRHRALVDITHELIQADEVPAVEINRVQAQAAAVYERLAQSQLTLLEARFGLAQTLGLAVELIEEAPLTNDNFTSSFPQEPGAELLAENALLERRDVRASEQVRDISRIFTEAARADLKRRIDLKLSAGLSTLYTSPFFRFLPDELDEPPPDTPIRFYSPRGYLRSFEGDWKPFFKVDLTFDLPFKNNTAEGLLLREQSSLTSSEISLTDLERTIRNNVIEVRGALDWSHDSLRQRAESIAQYQETLESTMAQYQAGDITLVDTLLTEEDLLREQLELVRATQAYLSILARLRFEVGTLIRFEQEGTLFESVTFEPSLLVTP